ncbi:MAG: hypothetical protein PWP24_1438, partial [Clostridiales bacterium]|nr:hypothetical protein [Clostridiales bacterium]
MYKDRLIYFAPLEGITGYVYRQVYQKYFAGVDTYFSPFIATNQFCVLKGKERRDILPENNIGIHLVPQLLSNQASDFIETAKQIKELGYSTVNLNLGCPSSTVVAKKKGAGFLADTERLHQFLEEIFTYAATDISIKTRIGMKDPE